MTAPKSSTATAPAPTGAPSTFESRIAARRAEFDAAARQPWVEEIDLPANLPAQLCAVGTGAFDPTDPASVQAAVARLVAQLDTATLTSIATALEFEVMDRTVAR